METRYIPQRQTGATCYGPDDYDECNSVDECSSNDDDEDLQTDGLVGKLKSKRVKELEAQLTRAQLEEERRYVSEQVRRKFQSVKSTNEYLLLE